MTSDTALPVELDELALGAAVEAWIALDQETRFFLRNDMTCLTAAISAYTRALSATRTDLWEPIETAPKDGSRILCWSKVRTWEAVHAAYWGRSNPMNPLGWMGGHCSINHIDQPTHWKPLPAPPITTEGE